MRPNRCRYFYNNCTRLANPHLTRWHALHSSSDAISLQSLGTEQLRQAPCPSGMPYCFVMALLDALQTGMEVTEHDQLGQVRVRAKYAPTCLDLLTLKSE